MGSGTSMDGHWRIWWNSLEFSEITVSSSAFHHGRIGEADLAVKLLSSVTP